jgi:selenocysteine lyase/cysteine desulfurase
MFFSATHISNQLLFWAKAIVVLCLVLAAPAALTQGKPSKTEMQQPNLDGLVEVSFKIDAAGKIQIVHINSTSPQLTEYVVNKLSKIKLSKDTAPDGKVITYRFVFKKQA